MPGCTRRFKILNFPSSSSTSYPSC
uniref:Uncharacterized protein n=1 Tax=Arundo donax TaxID=35708 RepID=A0A0A9H653_ARUDO